MKTTAPKLQPPAAVDRDLRAVARELQRTDWRLHLAAIALELGAISDDAFAMVRMAARMRVLDDLTTAAGQRAWLILAPWLPDEVLN